MSTKSLVNIKGSNSGLIFSFNTLEASFAELCAALEEKLLASGDFFINAQYLIQDEHQFLPEELVMIDRIMQKYQLQKNIKPTQNVQKEQREDVLYQAQGGDSVMITRGVRGGQKINIRGNAVIMGDINPGGEVMASGSIVVMGACRGLLHAGAEGDTDAFIVAYVLGAQQLRIADHVATVPAELADSPLKAAMIKDGTIVVTDYLPSQFKSVRLAQ